MTPLRARHLFVVASCVAVTGCLSHQGATSEPRAALATMGTPKCAPRSQCLDRAEIASVELGSLDEVLQRLRPEWLRVNLRAGGVDEPSRPSVYADGRYLADLEVLRSIPSRVVTDVRYLAPVEARVEFGSRCRCAGGVILVRTQAPE